MKRAYSLADIAAYSPRRIELPFRWARSLGLPELTGSWLIYGGSGSGKTSFAFQMARALAEVGLRVAYDSLEEGLSLSVQDHVRRAGLYALRGRFTLLDKEPVADLFSRLRKQRSPDVVFIDSWKYTGCSYREYQRLTNTFRRKLFVIIDHGEGSEPKYQVGKAIKFDAFIKIFVSNFVAMPISRYGGGEPFVVSAEIAQERGVMLPPGYDPDEEDDWTYAPEEPPSERDPDETY